MQYLRHQLAQIQPQQQVSPYEAELNNYVRTVATSPEGLTLGFLLLLLLILNIKSSIKIPGKGILSSGRLATHKDKVHAMKLAIKLIQVRKYNETACWIGTPANTKLTKKGLKYYLDLKPSLKSIWLSNAESGFLVLGINGSGKTRSFLLPAFISFLFQRFPGQLFDVKYSSHTKKDPSLTAQVLGIAKKFGYKISLFAPGLPESRRCNIITTFVKSSTDVDGALNLALTVHKTFSEAGAKEHPFFVDVCVSTLQGLFLLSLMVEEYPDVLTARQLFVHPNFPQFIQSPLVPPVVRACFDAYVDSLGAPEQIAGVKASVTNRLKKLAHPCLCGTTNMSVDLDGPELIIYGVDGQHRQTSIMINFMVLQMLTLKNLLRPRTSPLVNHIDEVSVGSILDLDEWPNLYRSAGLILLLGVQSLEMLIKRYGQEGARRIIKGCATHAIFQLNDDREAETYSKLCGQEDVVFHSSSQGTSKGRGGGGSSNNYSDHRQTKNLVQPYDITSFPRGKCVIFNRAYEDGQRTRIPAVSQIPLYETDTQLIKESVNEWEDIKSEFLKDPCPTHFESEDYTLRTQAIERVFGSPTPNTAQAQAAQPQVTQPGQSSQETSPHTDYSQVPIEELIQFAREFSNIESFVPPTPQQNSRPPGTQDPLEPFPVDNLPF